MTAGELGAVLNADESAIRINLERIKKEGFLAGSEEGYRIS
jgi:DNA-binding transcriptional regulator PaaX